VDAGVSLISNLTQFFYGLDFCFTRSKPDPLSFIHKPTPSAPVSKPVHI
jgi:hypothetical protein